MSNEQMNAAVAATEKGYVSTHKFLVHNKGDHVGVAVTDIEEGGKVIGVYMDDESTIELIAHSHIPLGHKIAIVDLEANAPVVKYMIQIGITSTVVRSGDYVHTHNIKTARW